MIARPVRVAYQGAPGAFSEDAIASFFGARDMERVPQREFAAVRTAVLDGTATYGVLPVRNSIHGDVTASLDAFNAGGLDVIGEVTCPVRLCLLALPGARPEQIRRVLSHPVALAQCRSFLAGMPLLEAVSFYDTAGAAEEVALRGDPAQAAVASYRAAAHYELDIIAADIEDCSDNRTRFMIVAARSHTHAATTGGDHVQGIRQRGSR
ncbi:MAG TPA: prephenate dehydratase domain-containing protein [Longimicrobiales bacterium]|nr:prephenate dehydratase domain-containing protein [Longimicrobiales bacterium]